MEKSLAAPPSPSLPRSPSERSDLSPSPSFASDVENSAPSPSSSLRQGGSPRRKGVKVSFGGESTTSVAVESVQVTLPTPRIVVAAAEDLNLSPGSSQQASQEGEKDEKDMVKMDRLDSTTSESEAPSMTRRKSLRDRLRGGLFWSGIKKRVSVANLDDVKESNSLGKMVNRMGPGAAFGAKTLLKKEARTASVQTVEATKLLVVTREDYVGLMSSMEEARAREAAEFLCRHVLAVEVRASSNRALDNLHPALRQRMAQTSKAMTSHALDRGMVLVTHGTETSDTVHILRKGSLAFCYPNEQQGSPRRWHRSNVASMNSSQVVSTRGELVGVHKALLNCKEPATVRVESASCEVYRVPWTELQRVLTGRVLSLMKDKLRRCHALRSGVAATQSPKDMLNATASSSIVGAMPSQEQQDGLGRSFFFLC